MLIAEFARSNNVNEVGIQWLYLCMGVCTSLGQILIGYVGDRPKVNTLVLHASTLLICGISTTLLPLLMGFAADYSDVSNSTAIATPLFMSSPATAAQQTGATAASSGIASGSGAQWIWAPFVVLTLFQLLFNFFISGQSALSTLLLVDFLSLEELTSACALIWCGDGVALIIGPPLLSLLAERSGNYNSTFVISGIALLLNSALLLVIAVPSIRLRLDPNYARWLLESESASEAEAELGSEAEAETEAAEKQPLDGIVGGDGHDGDGGGGGRAVIAMPDDKASAVWSPATRFTEMSDDADGEDTEAGASTDPDEDDDDEDEDADAESATDHSNLTPEKTPSSSTKY